MSLSSNQSGAVVILLDVDIQAKTCCNERSIWLPEWSELIYAARVNDFHFLDRYLHRLSIDNIDYLLRKTPGNEPAFDRMAVEIERRFPITLEEKVNRCRTKDQTVLEAIADNWEEAHHHFLARGYTGLLQLSISMFDHCLIYPREIIYACMYHSKEHLQILVDQGARAHSQNNEAFGIYGPWSDMSSRNIRYVQSEILSWRGPDIALDFIEFLEKQYDSRFSSATLQIKIRTG
jgi:hypothetical protein